MNRGLRYTLLTFAASMLLAGCGATVRPTHSPIRSAAEEQLRKGVESADRGHAELARGQFSEALRLSASIEYRHGAIASLINLSRLQRRSGQLSDAANWIDRAQAFPDQGDLAGEIAFEAALVALAQGHTAAAQEQAQRAIAAPDGSAAQRGARLNLLARVQAQLLDDAAAEKSARGALEASHNAAHPVEEANAERLLAELALKQGRGEKAEQHFARALELDKESGLSGKIGEDLRGLARCAAAAGRPRDEERYLRRAFDVSLNGQDYRRAAGDLERLAVLQRAAGLLDEAESLEARRIELLKEAAPSERSAPESKRAISP